MAHVIFDQMFDGIINAILLMYLSRLFDE